MELIDNYRFVVPTNKESKKYFKENHHVDWQSSDYCPIAEEGYTLTLDQIQEIPLYIKYKKYIISKRFENIQEFITEYWDGDVMKSDLKLEKPNNKDNIKPNL